LGFENQERSNCQHIHTSTLEAVYGLIWSTNNRFVFIEAGIQNHRYPRPALKCLDQIVVKRIFFAAHALQTASIVYMVYSTKLSPFFRTDFVNVQHKRRRVVVFKVFRLTLDKNRGGKRP